MFYTRTRQITPYWLFVKDIQHKYNISVITADRVAEDIWPTSVQRLDYKRLSRERKDLLKIYGILEATPASLLSVETCALVEEALLELGIRRTSKRIVCHCCRLENELE